MRYVWVKLLPKKCTAEFRKYGLQIKIIFNLKTYCLPRRFGRVSRDSDAERDIADHYYDQYLRLNARYCAHNKCKPRTLNENTYHEGAQRAIHKTSLIEL